MEQQEISLSNIVKKRKKSTLNSTNIDFDNLQSLDLGDIQQSPKSEQIIIPEPIQLDVENTVIDKIQSNNEKKKTKSMFGLDFLASTFRISNEEEKEEINETVKEVVETDIPDEVDITKTAEVLVDKVLPEIPDGDTIKSIEDVQITVGKDKSGYTKAKVTVKGSVRLSQLATDIKDLSGGDVIHRAMDLRNIANTNKNALKSSEYKLYSKSYNFKSKTSTKKYNRICLSLIDDDPNNVILFFQSGADKAVYKLKFDDKLIVEIISNYYKQGFTATKFKIDNLENPVPYVQLAEKIARTGLYKIKLLPDGIAIIGKGNKYYWLMVGIKYLPETDSYKVFAKSLIERDWKGVSLIEGTVELKRLMSDNFLVMLDDWFNYFDWNKHYDTEAYKDDNKYFLMYKKLKYTNLKKAFDRILGLKDEQDLSDEQLDILGTISREEIDDRINGEYAAEAIVGTSETYEKWLLIYSAVQVIGGDKRSGRDFITTDEYYQKQGVSDKSQYQNRKRTILSRQGKERNYNSRPYMFTLHLYKQNGKKEQYSSKNFEDLVNYLS